MSDDKPKSIYEKLHSVTENVEKIYKEQNDGMPYKSVNHNMVTQAVRKQIIKERLFVQPIVEENLNQGNIHKVVMSVKIIDIDNPKDSIEIGKFPALGLDSQDKGYGKAVSYAFKYILQKTFMMEIGEDEEVEAQNIDRDTDEIDYNRLGKPYLFISSMGTLKGETDDLKQWSNKIWGNIKYENRDVIDAYQSEMDRIEKSLNNKEILQQEEISNDTAQRVIQTINSAREFLTNGEI